MVKFAVVLAEVVSVEKTTLSETLIGLPEEFPPIK
jgi:hypothetical protein